MCMRAKCGDDIFHTQLASSPKCGGEIYEKQEDVSEGQK